MPDQRLNFDVLVVGAGPAGIAAACIAAENRRTVAVVDNSPWLGGQIWRGIQTKTRGGTARHWLDRLQNSDVQIFSSATIFASPSANQLLAETPDGVLEFKWKKLVLATGARELFLPFPGWTLPGVMGPGGLHAMAKSGWPVAEKKVVIAGSGPLLLAVADGLKKEGARVSLVAEQANWSEVMRFGLSLLRHPRKLIQGVGIKSRIIGVPYHFGCWPVRANGSSQVESVTLTDGSRSWTVDCDYLACGFHLVPNLELPRLLGCAVSNGYVSVNEFQLTSVPDVFCAGEPTGIGGVDCALIEGQVAGWVAVEAPDYARKLFGLRADWHRFRASLHQAFALRPELRRLATPNTYVCRCEDVRLEDLSNCKSWRDTKLNTRCGMGSCQGRICGAAAEFLFGWKNDSVRPPLFPVRASSLAGKTDALPEITAEPNISSPT